MKYSFIIPIFNNANYIKDTIMSITSQKTKSKYEIIVIDDGSTDNIKEVMEDIINEKKALIKYYKQKNLGVSVARNVGVKKSSGKYIVFLDSDDKIHEDFFKNIDKTLKKQDVEVLKTKVDCIENKKYNGRFDVPTFLNLTGKEALINFCNSKKIFATPWSYVFKRDFFIKENFVFKSNVTHEDLGLIPIILSKANSVSSVDWYGYKYIKRENSLSSKSDDASELRRIDDFLYHTYSLLKYFEKTYSDDSEIFTRYFYERAKIKVNNLSYSVRLKMHFENLTKIEHFFHKKIDVTSISYLPNDYKTTIEKAVAKTIETFETNLIGIILGGSCGKGEPISEWSDIDLYILLKKHDFLKIQKLYNELIKLSIHVGTTFYSLNEISNDMLDGKTRIMVYEKNHLNINPTLYGYSLFKNVSYKEVVLNDTNNLPDTLQVFRRMILRVESNEIKIDKKYIKFLILLLKCYLNMNYFYTNGYEDVINVFLKIYNSESTDKLLFDIIKVIKDVESNKKELLDFSRKAFDFIINEMEKINMEKRVSSRGIIIEDDCVYAMFRRRIKENGSKKEYYVIPGGGINENETLEENVIREMKEEFGVDIKINKYLGKDESDETIAHFFSCSITNGTPKLSGEELERCTESNYYEIRKVPIKELDNIDILAKDMILKAYLDE